MLDWAKHDSLVDLEWLSKNIKEVENNSIEYCEVPVGEYEVKITKLDLTESKSGKPMLSCHMKILAGEHKNNMIFMNQVLSSSYGFHMANKFLRALDDEVVEFKNFKQYNDLVETIYNNIDGKYEYGLTLGEKKGYKTFEITDRFIL